MSLVLEASPQKNYSLFHPRHHCHLTPTTSIGTLLYFMMRPRFIKESQEFICRGNVIYLAISVIIGAACGKVVSSLVSDIIMPTIALLLKGVNFKKNFPLLMAIIIKPCWQLKMPEHLQSNYGNFITIIIESLIVAASVFMMVTAMNTVMRNQAFRPTPPPPPSLTKIDTLLTEIQDLLKNNNEG